MRKTVALNVVGLTPELLGEHTPFLSRWAARGRVASVEPSVPAVTCTVQATYLTGVPPSQHGIVANGWYFRDRHQIKFWRQSNRLVQAPQVWEAARKQDPGFTCANLFWWYNMYSSVDYAVTPRPMYPADGRKIPDLWTQPTELRFELQERLGQFPLFEFWGPNTSAQSSAWIVGAAKLTEQRHAPTLTLVYLPHLDYNLQRIGPDDPGIATDLRQIDRICEELITFYEARGAQVMVLSEYGITPARQPVSLNRTLRQHGHLAIREELGRELLDAGRSTAFAVADHQLAHIYVKETGKIEQIRKLVAAQPGVETVLGPGEKAAYGLDHPRSGELVAIAEREAWFTYYYWFDDDRAPDFARTVAIHYKPGYDPAEVFLDPELRFPKLRVAGRLLQKKLGFRALMDVIPLDATLVKGSHGRPPDTPGEGPLLITQQPDTLPGDAFPATDVHDVMLAHLNA